MQLYLNKKLEIWEIVHHIDENKENDNIDNLEVINTKEFNFHTSMHHAGKRDRKTTKGDFYKKEWFYVTKVTLVIPFSNNFMGAIFSFKTYF